MDPALGPNPSVRRRAEELYRSARRAGNAYRPAEASAKLRKGLRLLDGANDAEGAELRIRMLITLSYTDAEINSIQEGLPHLLRATEILPQIPDQARRTDLDSSIRGQRGIIFMRAGRHLESIPELNQAIALREQMGVVLTSDYVSLLIDLSNRAHVYTAVGQPGPAGRDLRRVSTLAEVAQAEVEAEDERHLLAVLAARARQNLGSLAQRVGDLPRALKYKEEASRLFRDIEPSILPKMRVDQAETLLSAGLAEEAATHLDEALPELRRLRGYQDLAEAEAVRAAAALMTGDRKTARKMADSARRRFLRRGTDSWAAIAALTRLRADVALALDNGRPSIRLQARAVDLAAELGGLRLVDEASVARLLAIRLMLRRGDVADAEKQLDQVPNPRQVTPVDHRMLRRLCRAELAVAKGETAQAFSQARSGLAELSRVRDRMGGLELVSGTAVHGRELGELAVRLVVDQHGSRARQLFNWAERTRAQVYRYEPLPPLNDPVLTEKVQEYRLLSRSLREAERDGRPSRELRSRHAALQREVMRLGWRDGPWGKPRPIAGFAEVAEQLGERVLVSFVASRQEMLAVVLMDGRAKLIHLGGVDEAAAAAGELRADLDALSPDYLAGSPIAEAIANSAQTRAARLDDQLVRPLAKLIGDRELVVIPTGALYAVAWGVLPSLRGHPVSVAPSATAWLAAMSTPSAAAGRTVLVGGPSLPAAQAEVGGLRKYHPEAVLLEGNEATVQAVLAALDGASLAHVAAHGSHEPENALFSQLELVDGALYAHETARLRRPPEHVVLAACELALSRIRPGDEALGFAGALLAAGGRTVTAAVSRVGDQAAAAAMADYHRLLAAGSPPATALAEAAATDPLRRPFVCLGASRPQPA